jgi:hypothetical protein
MSELWYAVIAVVAAYVLFFKPFKLASSVPPEAVRLFLGVALVIGSGFFVFVVGLILGASLELRHLSQPVYAVGPAVALLFLAALGLVMGYIGARLIVMKKDEPLFKRTRSGQHRILVPPDSTPHADERARGVLAKAHERAPVDVHLREILNTAQVEGERPRRWFFSHEQDLLVWFGPDGTPSAFQLAYGKYRNEHALRWRANRGFGHYVVDDGERGGAGSKQAPLLETDGAFPASIVLKRFLELSAEIPRDIVEFIAQRLREYPDYRSE